MDVRCERCRAQYVFDDEQVTPAGLPVQCTNCGHVFRVKKKELVVTVPVKPGEIQGTPLPATAVAPRPAAARPPGRPGAPVARAPEPERPREWRVRQPNGYVFTFRELTTLQKWIVEQKVSRDDEIAHSGDQWRRLGDIAELVSFFEVVDAAERSRILPLPGGGSPPPAVAIPIPVPGAVAVPDPRQLPPPPAHEVDLGPDAEIAEPARRSRPRVRLAVALLLVLGAALAAALHPASPLRLGPAAPAVAPAASRPDPSPAPAPEMSAAAPEPPATSPSPPAAAAEAAPEPAEATAPSAEGAGPPPRSPPEAVEPAVGPAASPPARLGPKVLLAQARKLRERGELEAALGLYDQLVAYDPGDAEALTGRGLCYLDLERYLPAEASFEAALRIEPRDPDALLGLAETYRFEGKKPEAVRQYERYLAEHPAGEEADVARNAIEELRE